MSLIGKTLVSGHTLPDRGSMVLRLEDCRACLNGSLTHEGHARCSCGVVSPHLTSGRERQRWHGDHKGEIQPNIKVRSTGSLESFQRWLLECIQCGDVHVERRDGFRLTWAGEDGHSYRRRQSRLSAAHVLPHQMVDIYLKVITGQLDITGLQVRLAKGIKSDRED